MSSHKSSRHRSTSFASESSDSDHHTIDIPPTSKKSKSKNKNKKKNSTNTSSSSAATSSSSSSSIHRKSSRVDDDDDDDPYDSPPPTSSANHSTSSTSSSTTASTAGDQFYDSFAVLEYKIATGSTRLSEIIRILKQIRLHPHVADQLAEELEDKLSEAGALLNEIELIHKKFSNLSTQSNAQGKFSSEEKVKRTSLRDRVSQDIVQLTNSYRTLRQASQAHTNSNGNGGYEDDEEAAHHALLSDSVPLSPSGGLYQNSEYIGELDGHLAMLADQAAERQRFMKTIESDVVQVHDLFRDVNAMVNAQQQMVDDIDAKITDTQENARQGMEQLLQAQQYQAAKRKKMCCLVLVLIIAIFLFFLFIWVAFGG